MNDRLALDDGQAMTPEDVLDILQVFGASGFGRMELTVGTVRVAVNQGTPAGSAGAPSTGPQVVAPLLGYFQAGAEAEGPALVQTGTAVDAETTVGFVRLMDKLAPVKAGARGVVTEIVVENGQLVEFGQPLMLIRSEAMPSP